MSAGSWIDPEVLIAEIEKRPVLYAKDTPEYKDKVLKNYAWEDVARKLSENWDSLKPEQKVVRRKEMQAKWRNIRDNYLRDCHLQKTGPPPGTKKKRKYRYFAELAFLTPYLSTVTPYNVISSDQLDHSSIDQKESSEPEYVLSLDPLCKTEDYSNGSFSEPKSVESDEELMETPPKPQKRKASTSTFEEETPLKPQKRKTMSSTFEDEALKAIKRGEVLAPDEDTTFCLSLVQSLKKMDDESKMSAKIEILTVIRHITFRRGK